MTRSKGQERFRDTAAQLIRFSLPLILSGVLQQLYNWADAFIVGNVEGELALAAVGSTTTTINFYVMAITGFTLGLSILFAQRFGSGQTQDIPKILSSFCLLLGIVFLALAGAGILLTNPLLRLLRTTEDTFALAADYLRIVLMGIPFLAVYNVYSAALRGIGDSKAPFYAVLVSSITNVALDILFVALFRWNVAGAALATVVSQAAMTLFLILYSVRKHPLLRFYPGRATISWSILRQGVQFGLPPYDPIQCQFSGKPDPPELYEWFWYSNGSRDHYRLPYRHHRSPPDHQSGLRHLYAGCAELWRGKSLPYTQYL